MPRIARTWALVLGACSFEAHYEGGRYSCSDGVCPAGLICSASKTCVAGIDAAVLDGAVDARPAALTCSDPGPFPATGGTTAGTTAGRSNTVTATCGGSVMNGPDAIYELNAAIGSHIMLSITGSYPVAAYVIAPCTVAPGTPLCVDNLYATAGVPITVTTSVAGTQYIVVDGANPAQSGTYTLTVTAP
jgi:hypothetical protein